MLPSFFKSNVSSRASRPNSKSVLRLDRLEPRTTPSSDPLLITRANPATTPDTGGGKSWVADFDSPPGATVSHDGRYSVFTSESANLIAGQIDDNLASDVFLYDRVTATTQIVSRAYNSSSRTANGASQHPVISGDGRYVAYTSTAINIDGVSIAATSVPAVYLFDRVTGSNTLVSRPHDYTSTMTASQGYEPSISDDGRFVVFLSNMQNLVPDFVDNNLVSVPDVFRYDRSTQTVQLVSRSNNSASAGGNGFTNTPKPRISADGQWVVYSSNATNLVPGVTGTFTNTYLFNGLTGTNTLVSKAISGSSVGGNQSSGNIAAISADGGFIAFSSRATNLVPNYTGTASNLFLHNRSTGVTTLVSRSVNPLTANTGGNASSGSARFSADGRHIVFRSFANDLVAGLTDANGNAKNNDADLYHHDTLTGTTTLVNPSITSPTSTSNAGTFDGFDLSADGRYVLFTSEATDLVAGSTDVTADADVFVRDLIAQTTTRISRAFGQPTQAANARSGYGRFSGDGEWIAFDSHATDLVTGFQDTNWTSDLFVANRTTGVINLVTIRAAASLTGNGRSLSRSLIADQRQTSADGRYLVFTSQSPYLISGQVDLPTVNNYNDDARQDVFLYDRITDTTTLISRKVGTTAIVANGPSDVPTISADGRFIAFHSTATDLMADFIPIETPPNARVVNIFQYDRLTGQTVLVTRKAGTLAHSANASSGTLDGNFISYVADVSMSHDGRYIAYLSLSTDLVSDFVDGNSFNGDIYLFDRVTGTNTLVSRSIAGGNRGGNYNSSDPVLSGDGSTVVFLSFSQDLVAGLTNGHSQRSQVYAYDRLTNAVSLVSSTFGDPLRAVNGFTYEPMVSDNGRYVGFGSIASDLVAPGYDTNGNYDVFWHDRQTGTTRLASHAWGQPDVAAAGSSPNVRAISGDGRYLMYESRAAGLTLDYPGSGSSVWEDVFVWDAVTGENRLASRAFNGGGAGGGGDSYGFQLSSNGQTAIFASSSTKLTPGVSFGSNPYNIYEYDWASDSVSLVSGVGATAGNGLSNWAVLSRDASVIYFATMSDNLVPGDFNTTYDTYMVLRSPTSVIDVKVNDGSAQRSVVRSLTVTFDRPVTFTGNAAAAFTLTRNNGGGTVGLTANVVTTTRTVVTLTFNGSLTEFGSLIDGDYTLTFTATNLVGGGANYASPAGYIHRLFGDANGDRSVNFADFLSFRTAFGSTSAMGNAYDRDNDGDVDFLDFLAFRSRFGTGL